MRSRLSKPDSALQLSCLLSFSLSFLQLQPCSAAQLGRATFYGQDQWGTLNEGSCACNKRGGFLNPCSSQYCFDYIGEKQPAAGVGLIAALNTPGISNTKECGACYELRCVDGPTRGRPDSSGDRTDSACSTNASVTVMITDSCPCDHANPSNQLWCCGDTTHFDMSWTAFGLVARPEAGVIDVEYNRVPLSRCQTPAQGVNADTCNAYWGVLVSKDLWKLFVGIAVCAAVAGVVGFMFVKAVYGFGRRPEPFAADAA